MAGLLDMQGKQGVPYADPNAPAQPQPGAAPDQPSDDQSNVSPEEQQQYDVVMGKAADLLYGTGKGEVRPEILQSLKADASAPQGEAEGQAEDQAEGGQEEGPDAQAGKGNPAVLALANTAVQIVSKLDASAKEANAPIPDDVLYHAGSEIVGMLAEIAEAANIHNYSEEEIQGAFYQAVDLYRPIAEADGRTDDKTLKGQFGEILNADAQGQLGQLLPGVDQQAPTQQQ